MQRFKGSLEIIFIIALAMLLLFGIWAAKQMHRASLVSYEERINFALILDNAGSGLLGVLNSGEAGLKHMETLGASDAKGQGADFSRSLEQTLENLKIGLMQNGYSLKVLVSGKEAKAYGPNPPKGATVVETDTPLPCKQNGECKGRVKLGVW